MDIRLDYGHDGLTIGAPDDATVLEPVEPPPLADGAGAVADAFGGALPDLPASGDVAVVFPDLTRPFPHRAVLPVLVRVLEGAGVAPGRIRLLCATGTHRQATPHEMTELLGPGLFHGYRVHDHDARDRGAHVEVGRVGAQPVLLDRAYVDASVRIVTGFVEPHFFAGFSGGPKAVCPGLAALETVLEAHSPQRIADRRATWAELDANPVHRFVSDAAALAPPDVSVDVSIDAARRLTGVFVGALPEGHRRACRFVEATAMHRVPGPFDVVVTTNAGHPLDRNLYQSVKGMSAAARVARPGGVILCAAACADGVPPEGSFGQLLAAARTTEDLLDVPAGPDQWQVQVLGRVLDRARVLLRTDGLSADQVRAAHLEPVGHLDEALDACLRAAGPGATCGVLPRGPMTIASVA